MSVNNIRGRESATTARFFSLAAWDHMSARQNAARRNTRPEG